MKKLKMLFIVFTILIFVAIVFVWLTGRKGRDYKVLSLVTEIKVANKTYTPAQFASSWLPEIYSKPSTNSHKLLWTWYEIIDTQKTYDIIYYNCWENERNPHGVANFIYKVFRGTYYGFPLYDIEYILLSIDKTDENIQKCMFETSVNDDFNQKIVSHFPAKLERITNSDFKFIITDKDGSLISEEIINFKDLKFGIITWNHLLTPITPQNSKAYKQLNSTTLKALTESDYKKFKFSRKSKPTNF